jgi:hypothetical protein
MNFDVVIGNPPFQKPKKIDESKKKSTIGGDLWSNFVDKSLELCKDNGHVTLVHPPLWRKPEHSTWDKLTQYQIKYLEIHSEEDGKKICQKHFEKLQKPNFKDKKTLSKVIEGVDLDSDGTVDDCEFLE